MKEYIRIHIGGGYEPCIFDNIALAEAIIRSPATVYKVECWAEGRWADISSRYTQYLTKGSTKMKKITSLPKYALGQIIDLSYKHGGMPNRILVLTVFIREQDSQWQYEVLMENTGEKATVSEEFITSRRSAKSSGVYRNPDVVKRIEEGWRFCGNFEEAAAQANAKCIAENEGIANVRLYPALSYNNTYLNGQFGIWIRYVNTIYDDGRVHNVRMPSDHIDIK